MRSEALRDAIHAQPFRPFTLHLANGTTVAIKHPEYILSPPGARTAIVMGEDDSYRVLDIGLVVELQVGPPSAAGAVAGDATDGGE